jgi:anti-sigma factor RsiW
MMAGEHPGSRDDHLACVEAVEIIADYLEGALSDSERRRLEEHLVTCPGCTEYVAQMRTVAGSLSGLREEVIPAELREAALAAFRDLPKR